LVVGNAPRALLVAFAKWSAVLMSWIITDDEDIINIRAIIDTKTQAAEISELIVALYKRLENSPKLPTKENTDG